MEKSQHPWKLHSILLACALVGTSVVTLQAEAIIRCDALFEPKGRSESKDLADYTTDFKKMGFKVGDDNRLIDVKTGVIFGRLAIRDLAYLYEYASVEEHVEWKSRGGITATDMRVILAADAQAAGKGYYVSSNPIDSNSYGPALTVFSTTKPLLVLDLRNEVRDPKIVNNTTQVERLRAAGIDGVQYTETWFAIYNERQLKIPQSFDKKVFAHFYETASQVERERLVGRMANTGLWSMLPPNHPIRADFGAKYDPEILIRDLQATKTTEEASAQMQSILMSLREAEPSAYGSVAATLAGQANPTVLSVFKYVDMFTLDALRSGPLKDLPNAEFVAQKSLAMDAERAKIDIGQISTFSDFNSVLKSYLGLKPKVRSYAVVMTTESKSRSQKIRIPGIPHNVVNNNFLTIQSFPDSVKTKLYGVEYLNLDKITSLGMNKYFSSELQNRMAAYIAKKGQGTPLRDRDMTRAEETLLKDSITELTKMLFNPDTPAFNELLGRFTWGNVGVAAWAKIRLDKMSPDERALLMYRAFISIHPYEDGNGRSSRLYYEWASQQMTGQARPLALAKFDLDTFMQPSELLKLSNISGILNSWIAGSVDAKDYAKRLQISKDLIKRNFSYYAELLEN